MPSSPSTGSYAYWLGVAMFLFFSFMSLGDPAYAQRGCCSHHGGVSKRCINGRVVCNDGTLSPTCVCKYNSFALPPPPTIFYASKAIASNRDWSSIVLPGNAIEIKTTNDKAASLFFNMVERTDTIIVDICVFSPSGNLSFAGSTDTESQFSIDGQPYRAIRSICYEKNKYRLHPVDMDYFFTALKTGRSITFRINTGAGQTIVETFSLMGFSSVYADSAEFFLKIEAPKKAKIALERKESHSSSPSRGIKGMDVLCAIIALVVIRAIYNCRSKK